MLFIALTAIAQSNEEGLSRGYDTPGFARFKVENWDTTGTVGIKFVIGEDSVVLQISKLSAKITSTGPFSITSSGVNTPGNLVIDDDFNLAVENADTASYDSVVTDGLSANRITAGQITFSNTSYTGMVRSVSGNLQVDSTICHPWNCSDDTTFTTSSVWIGTSSPPITSKLYVMGNVGFIDLSNTGDTSYSFLFSAKDGLYQFEINDDALSTSTQMGLYNGGYNLSAVDIKMGDYDVNNGGTYFKLNDDDQLFSIVSANGFTIGDDEGLGHGTVLYQDATGDLYYNGQIQADDLVATNSFKYTDGNQASGKVLTSDVNGNATWQPAPSASPYTSWSDSLDLKGFASVTTDSFYYQTIGNMVFCEAVISGTSNADTLTLNLPYPARDFGAFAPQQFSVIIYTPTGNQMSAASILSGSKTMKVYASTDFDPWATSSLKGVIGTFFYFKED